MVDRVISMDNGIMTTELEIRPENILLSGELFLEGGMVEYLAQSYILACLSEVDPSDNDAVFLLGGVKKMNAHKYARIGQTIRSEVKRTLFALGIHQLQGNVYLGDELIFESIITVLQKKDE